MIALGGVLYYIENGDLYVHYKGFDKSEDIQIADVGHDQDLPFSLVAMGSYVIAFPKGVYFDTTIDPREHEPVPYGEIYKTFNSDGQFLTPIYTITNSQADGLDATPADTEPDDPSDGDYWIDTSVVPNVLKRWSATYSEWTQITTTFVCIKCSGIADNFKEMDAVGMYGSAKLEDGIYPIYHLGEDYIVVPGIIDEVTQDPSDPDSERLQLARDFPQMDFVVESGNRLWGCRYGYNASEPINEIYACALGDFTVWNRFIGLSTDSYAASRGCDGPWTGAVSYLDTVVFFKENHIEVVHPSNTGAHQIETYHVNGTGVAEGSDKSVAVVDNVVYYHGNEGFYAYTGGLPKKISYQLGETLYENAVGGDLSGFYYVCATDKQTGDRHLFVYDANRNVWYREDEIDIHCFCRLGSELYFCEGECGRDTTKLYCVRGTEGTKEPVTWLVVTHDFAYMPSRKGKGSPSHNYDNNVQKVSVRANITAGRIMKIYISYDSSYEWQPVGTIEGDGTHRYYEYPIVPARCDHFRLKFECNGDGCIWSIMPQYDRDD